MHPYFYHFNAEIYREIYSSPSNATWYVYRMRPVAWGPKFTETEGTKSLDDLLTFASACGLSPFCRWLSIEDQLDKKEGVAR